MSATIIPAETLAAKRRERERLRQECAQYAGSILDELDEKTDQSAPASRAREKETHR